MIKLTLAASLLFALASPLAAQTRGPRRTFSSAVGWRSLSVTCVTRDPSFGAEPGPPPRGVCAVGWRRRVGRPHARTRESFVGQ